ncbi:Glucan endo-1-3-beta-glucosidase 9 [Nymphaea thermarum]|nr:Glucan endo-1-3-beta-glucosidase 9 [Nymphaea thermarum]
MGMMVLLQFLLVVALSWAPPSCWWVCRVGGIGVNWGRESSDPLPSSLVVGMLKANNISRVRVFEAEAEVMEGLSGSGLKVMLGIPNSMLKPLSFSKSAAESWVHDNVTRYSSKPGGVFIEYIAVGNEPFLESYGDQFHPFVFGALINIHGALVKANLGNNVKVVVPSSFDVLVSSSGLPSKGQFRHDLNRTMLQVLTFLAKNNFPFVLNVNPFMNLYTNKSYASDFALFQPTAHSLKDGHNAYKNAFDASLDTLIAALSGLGFDNMDIIVGEVGWPTEGAIHNASPSNASTFINGLIDHLSSMSGTPLRPHKSPLEVYIFSLLDEDQRRIAAGNFERHWGIFTFDGQAKYQANIGHGSKELVNAQNVQYLPARWCVVNDNKELSNVSTKVQLACSVADCTALFPGGSCSEIGWPYNASYAFNSYYQMHNQVADSCYFGGSGMITVVNPSLNDCRFTVCLTESIAETLKGVKNIWLSFLTACSLSYFFVIL